MDPRAKLLFLLRQMCGDPMTLFRSDTFRSQTRISFERVSDFLDLFFVHDSRAASEDIQYTFKVGLGDPGQKKDSYEPYWSLDLLQVVSIMRQHPSIDIVWEMGTSYGSYSGPFQDDDVNIAVSDLKSMDAQEFQKLAAVKLDLFVTDEISSLHDPSFNAMLLIKVQSGVTQEEADELGFHAECGGIEVQIELSHDSDSDSDVLDSEEDTSDDE